MAFKIKIISCVLIVTMIFCISTVSGAIKYSATDIREPVSNMNHRIDVHSMVSSGYYGSAISSMSRDDSDHSILQRAILEDQLYKNMFRGFSMDPEIPYTPLDEPIPVKFMLFSSTGSDVYSVKINGIYPNSFIPHMELNQTN
jgi:hypothetical protein